MIVVIAMGVVAYVERDADRHADRFVDALTYVVVYVFVDALTSVVVYVFADVFVLVFVDALVNVWHMKHMQILTTHLLSFESGSSRTCQAAGAIQEPEECSCLRWPAGPGAPAGPWQGLKIERALQGLESGT